MHLKVSSEKWRPFCVFGMWSLFTVELNSKYWFQIQQMRSILNPLYTLVQVHLWQWCERKQIICLGLWQVRTVWVLQSLTTDSCHDAKFVVNGALEAVVMTILDYQLLPSCCNTRFGLSFVNVHYGSGSAWAIATHYLILPDSWLCHNET